MIDLLSMGKVTSPYGQRVSPTSGASSNHKGIDIVLTSVNVPSVMSGTVEYVGYSSSGGNMVYIRNNDGTLAKYMHLASPGSVSVGSKVTEGEIIGKQGSTGISTGNHLHFQVETEGGTPIDPESYLGMANTSQIVSSLPDEETGVIKGALLGLAGNLISFVVILLVLVLAVYLFMKAFDLKIL